MIGIGEREKEEGIVGLWYSEREIERLGDRDEQVVVCCCVRGKGGDLDVACLQGKKRDRV